MGKEKTAADVANEKMEEIRKNKASKSEEAAFAEAERIRRGKQGAPPEVTPPKQKTKDELEAEAQKNKEAIRQKAEAEAKENVKLLNTPDDKLDDEQKKKKAALKDQSRQDKVDKRIGGLHSEIQQLKGGKEGDAQKIAELTKEIEDLKTERNPDKEAKAKEAIEKAKQDHANKVIEEDKDKPPEERRDMSDDALNDWLVDNYVKATDWMIKRNMRKEREGKEEDKRISLNKDQTESYKRARKELPKMDIAAVMKRAKELKDAGKSNDEIGDTLAKEMPESALAIMISKEHPEWESKSNAPELIAEEVIKRMKSKDTKPTSENSEKLKKLEKELEELKAERAEELRQKGVDADISSSRKGKPMQGLEKQTELQEKAEAIRKKSGISKEKLAMTIERRKKIPGANTMTKAHYNEE